MGPIMAPYVSERSKTSRKSFLSLTEQENRWPVRTYIKTKVFEPKKHQTGAVHGTISRRNGRNESQDTNVILTSYVKIINVHSVALQLDLTTLYSTSNFFLGAAG